MRHLQKKLWPVLAILVALAAGRPAAAEWSRDDAAHLLRRAGFGGTPQQVDRLHAMGKTAAVEYLLSGKTPAGAQALFAKAELEPFKSEPANTTDRIALNRKRVDDIHRLRRWWVDRMVRTDRPLEEKMALFWHGLLTSGAREVRDAEMLAQQNELFHREALGNHKAMIHAILHDPAMLRYLNADQNVRNKPNENLARELMELFTLGEGKGYTEQDVKEVARALTGATVVRKTYAFRPARHDPGLKTIFGRVGAFGPNDVAELIFEKQQPAKYLARRLWLFFAGPEPTEAELRPIEQAIWRNGWEIRLALRAMFLSDAFYSDRVKFAMVKSPVELVVGTARMLDQRPNDAAVRSCLRAIDSMGQVLLQPPNVRGWVGGEQWITTATLYTRYNAAAAMVEAKVNGSGVKEMFPELADGTSAEELVKAAAKRFLQRQLNETKTAALAKVLGKGPLRLGQPQTDRRVRQMIALLMSTPEYQVE